MVLRAAILACFANVACMSSFNSLPIHIPAAFPYALPTVETGSPSSEGVSDAIRSESIAGKVIVVDPGHGGPDGGAKSGSGLLEKEITLEISKKLADYLRQGGAIVYMTRSTDRDLASDADRRAKRRHMGDLRSRVAYIHSKQPDMVLSVHCNAVPSSAWTGAQTIYMKGNEEGKRLAVLIQNEFKANLLPTKRQADDMDTLYLLKRVSGPVALSEVGFLSNPGEAASLATPRYQSNVAWCIYLAAVRYFAEEGSPRAPHHPS